jgi:hypothetical protein
VLGLLTSAVRSGASNSTILVLNVQL